MLTMRSKIAVRWSTSPNDLGYGHKPAPVRLAGKPDYIGSPRTVLEYLAKVRRNVGEGTYVRVEFSHRRELVEKQRLQEVLMQGAR